MQELVYALGIIVAALCSLLLLRGFARTRARLLLWSGLCFGGLALSNLLLFIDLVMLGEDVTLYPWRLGTAAVSMFVLVVGLITESD